MGGLAAVVIFLTFKTPKAAKVVQATFKEKLLHMDPIATVLTMGALICILLALQYGGVTHAWNSSLVIGLLVGFGVLSAALVAAELWQGERAMLTPRIMRQRAVWSNGLWGFFITGAYFVTLYYLPIYFQSIDNVSPIASGVRSIPLIILFGISTFASGRAITKTGVAAPYMVVGSVIVTIAAGLFFTLDIGTSTGKWIGFQILAGFGYGISFQVPVIIGQAFAAPSDIAPTTAIIICTLFPCWPQSKFFPSLYFEANVMFSRSLSVCRGYPCVGGRAIWLRQSACPQTGFHCAERRSRFCHLQRCY